MSFLKKLDDLSDKLLNKFHEPSIYLMRFGLGIAFVIHGKSKLPLPPQKLIDFFGFSPFLSSFIALSEIFSGLILVFAGFFKNTVGNLLTRISAITIVVIMINAFYFAHGDWFINEKLFTSEQIFLLIIGFYFLVNGNGKFKKK